MADIDLLIINQDETYVKLEGSQGIIQSLREDFSFYAPNYRWDKRYKSGLWDGKIKLVNPDNTVLKGLIPDITTYCKHNTITYEIDPDITDNISPFNISSEQAQNFFKKINGPFEPLKSQVAAFKHCVNNDRSIIMAPTSNGKSYMIHGLTAFYTLQKKRVLIIIDRSQLVKQLKGNFEEYGSTDLYSTSTIYDEDNNTDVLVSTWQSIYENPKSWFEQFDALIADEVHKFKAKSLRQILDKCSHISFRHGFTATLDNDSKTDRLALIGMFGTPHEVATYQELIEDGTISKPTIYAFVLRYSKETKQDFFSQCSVYDPEQERKKLSYQKESEYLENLEIRNKFISSIDSKMDGNTIIAFKNAKHGKKLCEIIKEKKSDYYFANHSISVDKRVKISKEINDKENATGIFSIGTFGTGINIININNIIISCMMKSKINVPQLIGRGLRKGEKKDSVRIIDIGDDMSNGNRKNFSMKHFKLRLQMYQEKGFNVKIKYIDL